MSTRADLGMMEKSVRNKTSKKFNGSGVRGSYLLRTALLCLLLALVTFGYFTLRDGAFTLRDDWNRQSLTFMAAMQKGILSMLTGQGGEWVWNLDLGSPLLYGFAFYNLGSPFTLLSLPFAKLPYPCYAGLLYAVKYMVAGVLAYLYLRPFVKTDRGAMTGAVLYAFSGFTAVNLMFQFMDSIALFPLILIGMERVLKGNRDAYGITGNSNLRDASSVQGNSSEEPFTGRTAASENSGVGRNITSDWKRFAHVPGRYSLFVFAVFLAGMTNYYFLIQEALFAIIYFLFRKVGEKGFVQNLIGFAVSGVLGVSMAAGLILPNLHYILGNSRTSAAMLQWKYLVSSPLEAIYVLRAMILPGDSMAATSAFYPFDYSSAGLWLPMIGMSLALAYVWKKRDRLSILMIGGVLISFSPLISSIFGMFTADYKRWWFMLSLMMALASVRVLEDADKYPVKKSLMVQGVLMVLVVACALLMKDADGNSVLYNGNQFALYVEIGFLGLVATWRVIYGGQGGIFHRHPKGIGRVFSKPITYISLFAAVSLLAAATIYHTEDTASYMQNYRIGMELEAPDPQYRYRLADNDLTIPGGAAGTSAFCSTASNSIREFDLLWDFKQESVSLDKKEYPGLSELMSGKYAISVAGDGSYEITERNVCPIGFPVYDYVTVNDLKYNVKPENRAIALMYAAAVTEENEAKVSPYLPKILGSEVNFGAMDAYIEMAQVNAVSNFTHVKNGFTCTTGYAEDQMIYFTIPYDSGWTAIVDETPMEIIDSNGMMLLHVPSGAHKMTFTFRTPLFREGLVVSGIAIAVFAVTVTCGFLVGRRKIK